MDGEKIVWVDVETTGLDPDEHEVWEIGLQVEGAESYHMFVDVDLTTADPQALEVGGYQDRYPKEVWLKVDAAFVVHDVTNGATLAGANPAFDAAFLRRLLLDSHRIPQWRYRLLDVEAYAAGRMGWDVPRGLARTLDELGVDCSEFTHHHALDDARMAQAAYWTARGLR